MVKPAPGPAAGRGWPPYEFGHGYPYTGMIRREIGGEFHVTELDLRVTGYSVVCEGTGEDARTIEYVLVHDPYGNPGRIQRDAFTRGIRAARS